MTKLKTGFLSLKIIINIILFFNFSSCTTIQNDQAGRASASFQSENNKSIDKKGRHFIVTIHGIRSEEKDLGYLDQVLLAHLKQLKPDVNYIILPFKYATGTNKNLFSFAYDNLSRFLRENIKSPTQDDSLIFVTHSQGGMISTIWKAAATYGYFKSTSLNAKPTTEEIRLLDDKIYADITDQIITLGTPFWGANIARTAIDLNILDDGFTTELKDLVFNSDLITWLRQYAVFSTEQNSLEKTEYTNIAGIIPDRKSKLFYKNQFGKSESQFFDRFTVDLINTFSKRYSFSSEKINSNKPDRFESDLAVVVPSTRSHFYYAKKDIFCSQNDILPTDFSLKKLFPKSKYILTESMHTTVVTDEAFRSKGMIKIPLACLNPIQCDHPTYRYILKAVANCENTFCQPQAVENIFTKLDQIKKIENAYDQILTAGHDLQGFSLDLNIQVPPGYDLPEKYYSDSKYTFREVESFDENGDEFYTRYAKAKTLSERKIRSYKLLKEMIKLKKDFLSSDLIDTSDIKIARHREGYSGLVYWGNNNELLLHLTGFIKPSSLKKLPLFQKMLDSNGDLGLTLPFEIELPSNNDIKTKKIIIYAKVKPGRSTFVRLNYKDYNCQ